jgi:hypothetical protein
MYRLYRYGSPPELFKHSLTRFLHQRLTLGFRFHILIDFQNRRFGSS